MKKMLIVSVFLLAVCAVADETVQLQYGVMPKADYIRYADTFTTSLDPDTTYGGYKHLSVSGYGSASRALLRFDIKEFVAGGATIRSAKLFLYPKVYTSVPKKLKAYPINEKWEQRAATWNVASPGVRWEKQGGEVDESVISGDVSVEDGYHTWDVTDIVQMWANFPAKNYGVMLKFVDEKTRNEVWYYSSETRLSEYRPRLEVTFITKEDLEKQKEDEKKRLEAEKNRRVQEILEGGKKGEDGKPVSADKDAIAEKALEKLGKTYETVKLVNTPYRSYSQVRPLADYFGLKTWLTSNSPGIMRPISKDKASASIKGKYGKGYYASWVTSVTKESTNLVVRVRSKSSFAVDVNQDNKYDKNEIFKLQRDHAGPITMSNVIADKLKLKFKYDYTFFIIKNPYKQPTEWENDSDLWAIRHGCYLEGRFGDKEVKIYDDNNDFKYDLSGEDTVSFNGEEQPLSTFVTIDGQVYKATVEPSGMYAGFAPASKLSKPPKMVKFDPFKDFNPGKAGFRPEYVLVKSVDSKQPGMYRATIRNREIDIPEGKYQIFFASVKSSRSRDPFIFDGQEMPAFDISGVDSYSLKWGWPVKVEFEANRMGDSYKIGVNNIKIVDACGARVRFPRGEKVFMTAPQVEFYPARSTRSETKKNFGMNSNSTAYTDLTVKVKKDGMYKLVLKIKTKAFGELKGEISR